MSSTPGSSIPRLPIQAQRQENASLKEQVIHLQSQLSEAEQALAQELGTSKGLRQDLQSVQVGHLSFNLITFEGNDLDRES